MGHLIILTAVMFALYSTAALLIWRLQEPKMLGIAAGLAGVCYVSAMLALLGEKFFSVRDQAVLGTYWAMTARTGIPLLAVLLMNVSGGPFAEPAAICYLIVFYFGALIVQVVLAYCSADNAQPKAAKIPSK